MRDVDPTRTAKRMICRTAVRDYALSLLEKKYSRVPAYMPKQVSASFYERCEDALLMFIRKEIESRPAKGTRLV